jgi:glutamate racemase
VASGAYEEAIRSLRVDVRVQAVACPLFVALVEEGWTEGPVARLTAERYLEPLLGRGIDTLVLGCTHYPLLSPLLESVTGPGVSLVDSAEATAAAVEEELRRLGLAAPPGGRPGQALHYVTDDAARFREIAGRWLGSEPDHLELVELPHRPAAAR